MTEINLDELVKRFRPLDKRLELVFYIYNVQGFKARRLDYEAAGKALGVDDSTISRYCTKLADQKIIHFCGNTLQLADDLNPAGDEDDPAAD